MNVEQGNKLIAEFMGAEWVEDDYGDWGYKSNLFPTHYKYWALSALKYHSSWDWLMPVVEKIELCGFVVEIGLCLEKWCKIFKPNHEPTVLFYHESKDTKEATWLAVIDFIQWYNTQKQ